jgi:hypothetical protein
MANGILKVGEITTSSGSGNITIGSGVTLLSNTPAFEARLGSDQTFSDAATVKVTFDTESFDTDNCYDNSTNYRFTPNKAGKYFVYTELSLDGDGGANNLVDCRPYFYKNGSSVKSQLFIMGSNQLSNIPLKIDQVIDMNGTTDYLEVYVYADTSSGSPFLQHEDQKCIFGAYRIGA